MNHTVQMLWPIGLIVLSNVFYHICTRSSPEGVNPFAALTATYAVGAAVSAAAYFLTAQGGSLLGEYKHMGWQPLVLGLAIVGLEAGYIYMYRAGWPISTAQLICSALLAVCLLAVGWLLWRESLTLTKLIGVAVCLAGLYLINK